MIYHTQMLQMLEEVWRKRPPAFTGLGVVFYASPVALPSVPLRENVALKDGAPVLGMEEISQCLSELSDLHSPWHDGFHFVDVDHFALTHLAQYLAPPLNTEILAACVERPAGARQMTALLTSGISRVQAVAVMSAAGEIRLYADGRLVSKLTVLQ
jgi:hypothetical protein